MLGRFLIQLKMCVADAISDMCASLTILLIDLLHGVRAQTPPDVRVIEALVQTRLEVWVISIRVILIFEAIPFRHRGSMKRTIAQGRPPFARHRPSHFNIIGYHLLLFIVLIVRMLWFLTFRWSYFTIILTLSPRFAGLKITQRELLLGQILRQLSWNRVLINVLLGNSFHVLRYQVARVTILDARHILDFPYWFFTSFRRLLQVLKAEVEERPSNLEKISRTLRVSSLKYLHRVTNLNKCAKFGSVIFDV